MKRQRGELVPIGDVLSDLGGPVKAARNASPQAQHHFTQADQVEQLVKASEADPDLGFMAFPCLSLSRFPTEPRLGLPPSSPAAHQTSPTSSLFAPIHPPRAEPAGVAV